MSRPTSTCTVVIRYGEYGKPINSIELLYDYNTRTFSDSGFDEESAADIQAKVQEKLQVPELKTGQTYAFFQLVPYAAGGPIVLNNFEQLEQHVHGVIHASKRTYMEFRIYVVLKRVLPVGGGVSKNKQRSKSRRSRSRSRSQKRSRSRSQKRSRRRPRTSSRR
jgi:hypothetical protein